VRPRTHGDPVPFLLTGTRPNQGVISPFPLLLDDGGGLLRSARDRLDNPACPAGARVVIPSRFEIRPDVWTGAR
jgi:hypothetical protein